MRTTSRSWKRQGKRFSSPLSDRNAALPSFDFSSVTDFGFQSFRTERSEMWVVLSHGVDSNLLQQLQETHPLLKKKTEFIERAFSSLQLQLHVLCSVVSDSLGPCPPGSSVHGMFQARILELFAISFSRGYS